MIRGVVVCFALLVTAYSIFNDKSIQTMVENAYKVTLVAAFVPLVCVITSYSIHYTKLYDFSTGHLALPC